MIKEKEYYVNADADKVKYYGQYFTPYVIAEFMSKWISRDVRSVLDPAAGNHIFFQKVKEFNSTCEFTGYEIDENIASHFMQGESYNMIIEDFLLSDWEKKYDAIICNPPYNRFQSIINRKQVQEEFLKNTGIKFSGYTNQYILFLIKCIYQMTDAGKLAFIIPSEFLNSKYGDEIKGILIDNKLLKSIIYFNTNVFENALTTSCIILLDKCPKEHVEFITLNEIESVRELTVDGDKLSDNSIYIAYEQLKNTSKWISFLKAKPIKKYIDCVKLSKFCKVSRGVATGNNDFYLFNKERITKELLDERYFKMCISRSADVISPIFSSSDLENLVNQNKNVYLLHTNGHEFINDNLKKYIKKGHESGVHEKFLPSKRTPWYSMECKDVSPVWIGTAGRNGIKVVRNLAGILNLTTFHSVHIKQKYSEYTDILFCYLLTPCAQSIISDNKKELGNGLDKYQPNDLNEALIIDLERISKADIDKIREIYNDMCIEFTDDHILQLNGVIEKYVAHE